MVVHSGFEEDLNKRKLEVVGKTKKLTFLPITGNGFANLTFGMCTICRINFNSDSVNENSKLLSSLFQWLEFVLFEFYKIMLKNTNCLICWKMKFSLIVFLL